MMERFDLVLPGGIPADLLVLAMCASLLVIVTHVPLGIQVLRRGIIFIDLALAQVAGLGAYLALNILGENVSPIWTQLTAAGLALLTAWCFSMTEKFWPKYQEAIIGVVFVLSATAVLLLLSSHPHGANNLTEQLSGQLLWVGKEKLEYSALATILLLIMMYMLRARQGVFYMMFALAITISVQLVGVYLVFATLIIPALGVVACQSVRAKRWLAYGIAIAGYMIGLFFSAWLDFPTGPLIVWTLGLTALVVALFNWGRNKLQQSTK